MYLTDTILLPTDTCIFVLNMTSSGVLENSEGGSNPGGARPRFTQSNERETVHEG